MTPIALPEAGLLPIGSDLNQGWLIGLFLSQKKIPSSPKARGESAGSSGAGDNLRIPEVAVSPSLANLRQHWGFGFRENRK